MMRKIGLAASAALASAISAGSADADTVPFNFTGAIVDYTAPTTGLYSILAFGAQGGAGGFGGQGGLGAEIGGTLSLTKGDVLEIAVGGAGISARGGSGGGGSFVYDETTGQLLIAAGGGGGAGTRFNGGPGQTGSH